MAIADALDPIKVAIHSGDKSYAREQLKEMIKNSPSAEVWYLASKVASSKEQSVSFLQKALDLDPFHEPSNVALEQLQTKTTTLPIKRKQNGASSSDSLLTEAVAVFVQNDWELKMQMNNMAQLEKRRSVSTWGGALLVVLFGLVGCLLVAAAIATSKKEKVSLQAQESGSLRVMSGKQNFTAFDAFELTTLATSVKQGMTYGSVVMLGIVSTIIWFVIL